MKNDPKKMLLILLIIPAIVLAWENGEFPRECSFLVQFLTRSGTTMNAPYNVLLNPRDGQVHVILTSLDGLAFKGFTLFARDAKTNEFLGDFTNIPKSAKAIECGSVVKNAVTNSSTDMKSIVEFDWVPRPGYKGTVFFQSTFSQGDLTFWIQAKTSIAEVKRKSIVVPKARVLKRREVGTIYHNCGIEKACFGIPSGCIETENCVAVATVRAIVGKYRFELQTRDSKYVAVGLSADNKMGQDSVAECVNENGNIVMYSSWNFGKKNSRQLVNKEEFYLEAGMVFTNAIYCSFLRTKETFINGRKFNLENTPYYLLLAAGTQLKNNGLCFHDVAYDVSTDAKLLSEVNSFTPRSKLSIRAHGTIMVTAWIGATSIGILLARYYKNVWSGISILGNEYWFFYHRFLMLFTCALTIVGMVVIFFDIGGWSQEVMHSSMGLTTAILAIIQLFMAVLRPSPISPTRPVFNWMHWLVGNVAQICGITTIFLAVRLKKAELPDWVDWMLVSYVVFHALVHIILSFISWSADRQARRRANLFRLNVMHPNAATFNQDVVPEPPSLPMKKCIFTFYVGAIVFITVVLIIIISLAPIYGTWVNFINHIQNY